MSSSEFVKETGQRPESQGSRPKVVLCLSLCTPFFLMVIVGLVLSNEVVTVTGGWLFLSFSLLAKLLATRIDQIFAYAHARPPLSQFVFISRQKTMLFAAAANVTSAILVIPPIIIYSNADPVSNRVTYIVFSIACLGVDYRLFKRGTVSIHQNRLVLSYFWRRKVLDVDQVLGVETSSIGKILTKTQVRLRMRDGSTHDVPGFSTYVRESGDTGEGKLVKAALSYLTLMLGSQSESADDGRVR